MDLYDTRNALERAMLHFSDLEKETERIDDKHYRVTLKYRQGDETEILIRILSFGPRALRRSPRHGLRLQRTHEPSRLGFLLLS